jgi:hypothetical protein
MPVLLAAAFVAMALAACSPAEPAERPPASSRPPGGCVSSGYNAQRDRVMSDMSAVRDAIRSFDVDAAAGKLREASDDMTSLSSMVENTPNADADIARAASLLADAAVATAQSDLTTAGSDVSRANAAVANLPSEMHALPFCRPG